MLGGAVTRCRLCAANDREALVAELAERMWESRRDPVMDFAWAECGSQWQGIYTDFARHTLYLLDGRMA